MTPERKKAIELLKKVDLLAEGWRMYAIARQMAIVSAEEAKECKDLDRANFYVSVHKELLTIEKENSDESNKM